MESSGQTRYYAMIARQLCITFGSIQTIDRSKFEQFCSIFFALTSGTIFMLRFTKNAEKQQ